jgi:transcriptional regulator with XRE-family HTH domain
MSFGERIRERRLRRRWSLADLAQRAGVDRSTIHGLERKADRLPNGATLEGLARAFGVTVAELLQEPPAPTRSESFGSFARVAVMRSAHAGRGGIMEESAAYEWVPVNSAEEAESLLAAPILGDCMAPMVEPGDTVIWDSRQLDPEHGQVIVVTTSDGELLVKRAVRKAGQGVYLTDRHGQLEQPDGARIEGVVVRIIKIPGREI